MLMTHVITRNKAEQSAKQPTQRDVVISNKEYQCHPELVSGSLKFRRFRNLSWIIGRSAGSTQPSLGRVPLSLHSCQNPQFGMTIINNSPNVMDCYVTLYKKLYTDNINSPHNDMKRFVPSPLIRE